MERFNVQTVIGSGAQHRVGRIGDGLLIKYPHWKGRHWDASTTETVRRDLSIHQSYGIPIPETRVISSPIIDDGESIIKAPYAIITQEIRGRIFREADLDNHEIREQVRKLTADSLDIREKFRAGVDFLGGAAFGSFIRYLIREKCPGQLGAYNVLIDSRNHINLIDTNLLDPARAPALINMVVSGLIDLQNGLMAHILEDEKLKQRYLESNAARAVQNTVKVLYGISRKIEKRRREDFSSD